MLPHMEPDTGFVSRAEFDASIAALMSALGRMQCITSALALVLRQRGVLTPDLWNQAVDHAMDREWAKKAEDAIQKLSQSSPLQQLLKDFEGPPQ